MAELTTVAMIQAAVMPSGTTADTTFITALIERAEEMMRTVCNRPLGWLNTSAKTETFPGSWTNGSLVLRYTPATAITTVKVYTASGTSSTLDSTGYRIMDDAATLAISTSSTSWEVPQSRPLNTSPDTMFAGPYPYTEVVYTGGYANQAAVPNDLEQAAIRVAALLYNETRGAAGDTTARLTPSEINEQVAVICRPYIRGLGVGL